MKNVIVVFDIGKTNKKCLLFDQNLSIVYEQSKLFEEIVDDDNFPCDDIEAIENWIKNQIESIQKKEEFTIKAINFSTHGATLVYLDKNGKRITPLYNYLKPIERDSFEHIYNLNGGIEEFSRKTASPAYGMLNSGLQISWLKRQKPHFWEKVNFILHYPQYLSYLFTHKITADYTSIGAHTAIWDFDTMTYHKWLKDESIYLPQPTNGKKVTISNINGFDIAIGTGLHDSSSSIIPLLKENHGNEFILLSTGTWIITMNPFSKEILTQHQLNNNCLCFMTPEKKQIKASMQFLGKIHEDYLAILSSHFKVNKNYLLSLKIKKELCYKLISNSKKVFLNEEVDVNFKTNKNLISNFNNYEEAYYQLVFEICKKVVDAIDLILDKNNTLKDLYVSGGFNKNTLFIEFLTLLKPNLTVKIPKIKNESALGAAILMKQYL